MANRCDCEYKLVCIYYIYARSFECGVNFGGDFNVTTVVVRLTCIIIMVSHFFVFVLFYFILLFFLNFAHVFFLYFATLYFSEIKINSNYMYFVVNLRVYKMYAIYMNNILKEVREWNARAGLLIATCELCITSNFVWVCVFVCLHVAWVKGITL